MEESRDKRLSARKMNRCTAVEPWILSPEFSRFWMVLAYQWARVWGPNLKTVRHAKKDEKIDQSSHLSKL
jgi:hypothetical protein